MIFYTNQITLHPKNIEINVLNKSGQLSMKKLVGMRCIMICKNNGGKNIYTEYSDIEII